MALLQWNQVAAPNMTGVAQLLQQRQASWDAAFAGIEGTLGGIKAGQVGRADTAAALALGGITGTQNLPAALEAARRAGQVSPELALQIAAAGTTANQGDLTRADIGLRGGQTEQAYSAGRLNDANSGLVDANRLSVLGGERRTDQLHNRAISQEDSAIALNGVFADTFIRSGSAQNVGSGGVPGTGAGAGDHLGALSGKYEGGYDTVGGDGGRAYGRYQFDGPAGGLSTFFNANPSYAAQFEGLTPGSSAFNQRWQDLSRNDPGFNAAQDSAAQSQWYAPAAERAGALGFNLNNRGVQEAVFSGSIQHGGINKILEAAAATPGFAQMSPEQQINAFYNARGNYVMSEGGLSGDRLSSVINRYDSERQDALAYAGGQAVGGGQGGGGVTGVGVSTQSRISAPLGLDYGTMTPAQIAEMWGSVGDQYDEAMDQSGEDLAIANADRTADQAFLEQSLSFGQQQNEQASIQAGTQYATQAAQQNLTPAETEQDIAKKFADDPIAYNAAMVQAGLQAPSTYQASPEFDNSGLAGGAEATIAAYAEREAARLAVDPMIERFDNVMQFEGMSGNTLAEAVQGQMPELSDMPAGRVLRAINEVVEKTGVSEQIAAAALMESPKEVGIWEGMTTFGGIERGEIILDSDRASEIARQMADPSTVAMVQERRNQSAGAIATAQADLAEFARIVQRNDLAESRGQGRPQQAEQDALLARIQSIGGGAPLPAASPTGGAAGAVAAPSPVSSTVVPGTGLGPTRAAAAAQGLVPAVPTTGTSTPPVTDQEAAAAAAELSRSLTAVPGTAPAPEAVAAAVGASGAPVAADPATAAPAAPRPLAEVLAAASAVAPVAPPTPELVPPMEGTQAAAAVSSQSQASTVVAEINGQEITAGQLATLPQAEQQMVMGLVEFQAYAQENVSPALQRMLSDPNTDPRRKAQAIQLIASRITNDEMLRAVPEQQQAVLVGLQTMAGL